MVMVVLCLWCFVSGALSDMVLRSACWMLILVMLTLLQLLTIVYFPASSTALAPAHASQISLRLSFVSFTPHYDRILQCKSLCPAMSSRSHACHTHLPCSLLCRFSRIPVPAYVTFTSKLGPAFFHIDAVLACGSAPGKNTQASSHCPIPSLFARGFCDRRLILLPPSISETSRFRSSASVACALAIRFLSASRTVVCTSSNHLFTQYRAAACASPLLRLSPGNYRRRYIGFVFVNCKLRYDQITATPLV
jgi:hypothetical protein